MKQNVVFLHYHGIGHINPCLPLAEILERNTYTVHFAGVEFFRPYVSAQHFSFYGLKSVPFGLGFETWLNTVEKKKNIYSSTLHDRITDRLYKLRENELVKMLDDLHPEVILLDATQATDFIVLYPHLLARHIKVGMLHAMFPTHVVPGRPPANAYAFPENEKDVSAAILKMKISSLKKAWRQKIKYLFFDDQMIINRRLKKNKIPLFFRDTTPSLFYFNVRHIAEFILAPREFDFPDFKAKPTQHYIGFMQYMHRHDAPDAKYLHTWETILARKISQNKRLMYCSFGTIELEHKHIIFTFLNKLIHAVQRLNLILIVSMKDEKAAHVLFNIKTDAVYFFTSVPQMDVLRNADVFLTHGGLSSIKESIDAGVPMLMYPVHSDYDPKGNAARVVYHGMGLRGDVQNDSEEQIQRKVVELLTHQKFKESVLKMKQKNAAYTAENFMSLIEALPPLRSIYTPDLFLPKAQRLRN
jgi:zeaxanthin glucosyltransferase